ncbi:restriction endonuclease subunit S [Desulfococcaceae bacterium HSG7]|nr:restriction endonuclease subunit S [Desulfococcaceae bacterium HSG7]
MNPDTLMKDSCVEWLGEIPGHWDVRKLKFITKKVGSGVTPSGGATVYVDEGIPLLRSQNIHFDRIDLTDVARIPKNIHHNMLNTHVKSGDVLLNITGASLGRCFFVTNLLGEANVNQHVCIVRPNNYIKSKLLNFLLASEIGQHQIWFFQQGGGREGLNFQNLKNFQFPIPPITEQHQIATHIETKTAKIDQAIEKAEKEIILVKEYLQSLIYQIVTGRLAID